ncbi:TonB-dependent receptor [Henriciella sp.]|uniref:TonB-dependent receptor n=1 Tax=Henriciella sp. TaxID=1968823 RepID=UPI00260852A5|nr:TonB-dependent receptor [Henriciella sp.]
MDKTYAQNESVITRKRMFGFLLCTASAMAIMQATPAVAQEEEAPETIEEDASAEESPDAGEARLDTVTVKGIRSSIASSQDIKRRADTLVDAITAEDIGALPDGSVTESLQRVPGVSISRFAAADDPDHFSIEGSGVVVRGLTYVRSELNGRDTFTANNGRALTFSDISPELLASVQVYKNQTADLIPGGIAGTVNLVTRKPFDTDGQKFAGTLEYEYSDFRDEGAPTGSLLYSNEWDTDIGRVGFLVSGVYSELKTRSDGAQISSFQPRDDLADRRVWVPEGAVVRTQEYDRERTGYGGSAQWESNDDTMLATFEYLRSEATTSWNEHASEIATDNVGDSAFFFAPGTEFGFGGDDLLQFGTISAPVGWRADQQSGDARVPVYGLQSNNIFRGVEQETVTEDTSLNFKWTPTDRWSFNFDYQHVDSTTDNIDFGIWGSSFQDVRVDLRPEIPEIEFLPPNMTPGFGGGASGADIDCSNPVGSQTCPRYFANGTGFNDPVNSFWRAAMDHSEQSEGSSDAFRIDANYDFEDDFDWVRSVRFGGRYNERDLTTRFSVYNWGALSEVWGNGGPIWMDDIGVSSGVVDDEFNWNNYQRGDTTQPPSLPFFGLNPAQNYDTSADFADAVVAAWLNQGGVTGGPGGGGGGWRRLSERPGTINGSNYLPGEVTDSAEEITSYYAKLNFGHDDPFGNGMTVEGNIGLRYVETQLASSGGIQYGSSSTLPDDGTQGTSGNASGSDCIPDDPAQNVSFFCTLSPEERAAAYAFLDDSTAPFVGEKTYENWLPSLNVKLGLTDDKFIRFAYSKAFSRPDVGLTRATYPVSAATQDDPANPGSGVPDGFSSGFYGFQTSGGNPFLEPVKSDQYDLAFEWYFSDTGSFTATAFYKEIEDIIVSGSGTITLTNNGETFDVFVTNQPTNSDETGTIKGFELAYSQFYDFLPYGLDGLGLQAAYTYIDSEGVNSSTVSPVDAEAGGSEAVVDLGDLPLEGLSEHNANVALIYEKGPVSARVAYNWRDEYLVTARDTITPFYPIFQNASGQVDGSIFYTVNDNFKIGVQFANLFNEITETESFIPNSDGRRGGRSWFQNDRRFTLTGRFNF